MTLFVLDSDTISLLQDRHPKVIAHIASHAAADVATTIISVEEQLSAWYTLLRRATTPAGLVPIYQRMSETVRFFSTLPLLTFDDTAAEHYERDSSRRSRGLAAWTSALPQLRSPIERPS